MENFYKQACNLGFSDQEIDSFREILTKKEEYLTQTDKKGAALNEIVSSLSHLRSAENHLDGDTAAMGDPAEIDEAERERLRESLMSLWPWRKGPFSIFGIFIDCEWKSYMKWNRLKDEISPLKDRHVLDIGSSNGYYMFRMASGNPSFVLGIEPYTNFYYQFRLLNSIAGLPNLSTLPLRLEELPPFKKKFNTVFCMGILYHRKSPLEFLIHIRSMLAGDGELVLETLIIRGEEHICLYPEKRYAKMLNVYFIPTVPVLTAWLKKAGFREILFSDISDTTEEEQRTTEWVKTESLKDFLNPEDSSLTVEGYPAPVRAVVIARV